MFAFRISFGTVILSLLSLSIGPVWAQSPGQTAAAIRAEAQAIEAEARALEQGEALKRQDVIQKRLDYIREHVALIDRCLAASARGDIIYMNRTYCIPVAGDTWRRLFVLDAITNGGTAVTIERDLLEAQQASDASVRYLQGLRRRRIEEFNQQLASLTALRNGARGNIPAAAGSAALGCAVGAWHNQVDDGAASTWSLSADGRATESGLGSGTGTATMSGNTLTIEWKTANGFAGNYIIRMDANCSRGAGTVSQVVTPPGIRPNTHNTTFTR